MYLKISKIVAVWAKIVVVFGKIFWGGFWRVWASKVAVSDFDLLETLVYCTLRNSLRRILLLQEQFRRFVSS